MKKSFNKLKIIKVSQKEKNKEAMIAILKDTIRAVEEGQLTNILIAGFAENGDVMTGYSNANYVEQHTLISYLNVDLIRRICELNMDKE